jgi:hypothetical protein
MGANKPIEDIEATLLAATQSALDELVWWAHATMAAKAAVCLPQVNDFMPISFRHLIWRPCAQRG